MLLIISTNLCKARYMYVKIVVIMNFTLRTLHANGADPRDECSMNLRLDQDIVKLFEAGFRLENVWKMSGVKSENSGGKVSTLA